MTDGTTPTGLDHALLSAIAYSRDVDDWNAAAGQDLQDYIRLQLEKNGPLCIPPEGKGISEDEWRAILEAAASSETLAGFTIGEVAVNPRDGSNMIYLRNEEAGEGCFVFEGTDSPRGWLEDGRILASGDTASQRYAVGWAQGIMDAEEAAGHDYRYAADGHSKGGNQAAVLAALDHRIAAAYSFDGPGDDRERARMGDPGRIHCYNNADDIVSALLWPLGGEVLLRPYSEDPDHIGGLVETHSPSGLFSFRYDERGVLACEGLGEDVTAQGGALHRLIPFVASRILGSLPEPARTLVAEHVGRILYTAFDSGKPPVMRIGEVLALLLANPLLSGLLLAALAAGIEAYGVARIRSLLMELLSLLGTAAQALADAAVLAAQALEYMGGRLKGALDAVAGALAPFVDAAWGEIRSWVAAAVDRGRALLEGIRGLAGDALGFAAGLVFGGARVYDFSPARLDELEAAWGRARAVESFDPFSWSSWYAGSAFMSRLSLGPSQAAMRSSLGNEWEVGGRIVARTREAFRLASAEDGRFARGLGAMASSVNAATALLA